MENTKLSISANDMEFQPITEHELKIISLKSKETVMDGFVRRAIISVIVMGFVAIMEYIGRINTGMSGSEIRNTFIFIIVAGIVFNLLSFGYGRLKLTMDSYIDHSECLYVTVTEKYSQAVLERENKKRSNNYLIVETDKYRCTTAFPVDSFSDFKKISVGEKLLLVRISAFGDISYKIYSC